METSSGPLVSVGIPTRNREAYVGRAITKLLNQTHRNLEILISDNGSTDRTEEVCRGFAEKDSRVRYVRHPGNKGAPWNFRWVLEQATGKYFMWHADDDYFDPSFVEQAVNVLEDDPDVVLCFCDYRFVNEQDEPTGELRLPDLYPGRDWREARKEFFSHPYWRATVAFYGLHRRAVLLDVGPPEPVLERSGMIGTEAPLLSGMAAKGRVVVLPEILFSYMEHATPDQSLAERQTRGLSRADVLYLQAAKQLKILQNALQAEAPLRERMALAKRCVRSAVRRIRDEILDRELQDPREPL